MTFMRSIACVTMLAVAMLAGCEKDDTTTTGTGTGTGAAGAGADTSTAATPSAATPDATTDAAAQTAATSDTPTTAPAGTATAAELTQAQTLLDQTVTYIKENKMDLAEKGLTQLEQLKPKLPVEYHSKIDGARKAFTAAKTGQGLKLDGLLPGGTAK
jgi:hypothetical protein